MYNTCTTHTCTAHVQHIHAQHMYMIADLCQCLQGILRGVQICCYKDFINNPLEGNSVSV